jgi:hypothetical protein
MTVSYVRSYMPYTAPFAEAHIGEDAEGVAKKEDKKM